MFKVLKKNNIPIFNASLFVGAAAPPVAGPLYTASPALNSNDANFGNSFRVVVPVTGTSLTQIRATIRPGTVNSLTILHASIGKWAGNVLYPSTTATPIELLFGGVSGFSAATTPQTSDWANLSGLTFTTGEKAVVIYDITAVGGISAGTDSQSYNNASTGVTTFFQSVESYNTANVDSAGFTDLANTNYCIDSVETQ